MVCLVGWSVGRSVGWVAGFVPLVWIDWIFFVLVLFGFVD